MTTVSVGNRWSGDVFIGEYEAANHGTHTDDDWKDGDGGKGFGAEYLDVSQYVDGTEGLEKLVVIDYGIVEDLDFKVTKLAGRTNFKIGTGAGAATVTLKCLCLDDSTDSAEDKANRIISFVRRHDKMTDDDIYLVMRRDVGGTYEYWEWEDGSGNYDRKWLQIAVQAGKPKFKSYGVIEINLQCTEVNT